MYKFFYDESFHDRKITIKNRKLNIHDESKSDSYVGAFIGYKAQSQNNIMNDFRMFEDKHKKNFGLSDNKELKGVTISSKNYEYGIASFNQNAVSMYNDLFDILVKRSILLQIIIESKTEYLLEQFLNQWIEINLSLFVSLDLSIPTFKYILIKYLFHHQFPDIIMELVNKNGEVNSIIVKNKLIEILEYSLTVTSSYERTIDQNKAIRNILEIIKKMQIKEEYIKCDYGWDYTLIFKGFNKYLVAEHIDRSEVTLTLDREKNTFNSAKTQSYHDVIEVDSTDNLCVRISDMISNFYGRMIHRLQLALKEPDVQTKESLKENEYQNKRHISTKWFELNEKQFNLYKLLSELLMKSIKNYWSFHGGVFFDSSMIVIGLILYIGQSYTTFEEYQLVSTNDHSIKCTNKILGGLESQWLKLLTSLF